jgi:hypothetical protein
LHACDTVSHYCMYICLLNTSLKITEKRPKHVGVLPHVDILFYLIIVQLLEYLWWCAIYIQSHDLYSRWTCTWASRIQFPHLPFQYIVITPLWNILYVMLILWWCFAVCNNGRWIVLNMYHSIITVTCAFTSTLHVCLQLQHSLGIKLFTELKVTDNCNVYFKFRILFFKIYYS